MNPGRLFVACHPALGHITPYEVMVRALVRAGHTVRWYGPQEWHERFRAAGADPVTQSPDVTPSNVSRLFEVWNYDFRRVASDQAAECMTLLADDDLAIVDATVMGVRRAAQRMTVPTLLVNCTPAFNDGIDFTRAAQATVDGFEFLEWGIPCIGPLLPPLVEPEVLPHWATKEDTRPLIFVTQGTLALADALISPTIEALRQHEKARGLVCVPNKMALRPLPPNVTVVPVVDYRLALRYAHIFITNGGYHGLNMALAAGVPVIVAGEAEDKIRTGELVEWAGVGINLRTATPSVAQILHAAATIERTPRYRERARELSLRIALAMPAPLKIAALVDDILCKRDQRNCHGPATVHAAIG
jgi:UDP:flavonoid glycosyltransferase YjiC (YdhE family)